MVRICKEESFHQRQGFEILHTLSHGTPAQHAMAQDAVDRWWWPSLMMFGPPDDRVAELARSRWPGGSSGSRNDELRQRFVDMTRAAGRGPRPDAARPRPALERRDAGTTTSAPIDWAEFFDVLKGNGPCNARADGAPARGAHEEGAWVREAAAAYAAKQAAAGRTAAAPREPSRRARDWPLWEVFVRARARPVAQPRRQPARPRRRRWRCATPATSTPAGRRASRIWVVPAAAITASQPGREGLVLRPGRRQGLPAPDVLRHPRRGEHL